jgi:ABC-type antimicrobial peptide transport system permease subunit
MKWRIIWMVVSEVILLGLVGLAFGLAGVWEVAAFLKSFLWGLQAQDSATFAAAALILLLCTLTAGFAPAWRAARIDPLVALRHE